MVDVNDDAKCSVYRRVGVLTGPGRRRKWSDETKAGIVAETLEAGWCIIASLSLASAASKVRAREMS
jgi:transposase-like protein